MSDYSIPLPTASVDITEYRKVVESASHTPSVATPGRIGWLIVLVAMLVSATIAAFVFPVNRAALAGGLIAVILVLILVVMLPARRAADEARRRLAAAASALDRTAAAVTDRLASIGYEVPFDTAVEWLTSPQPSATVPLVHDSVIAARWWRPAAGDDRVFLEAFLRQPEQDAALPVLRPLQRD